jgi:hypothetical protein
MSANKKTTFLNPKMTTVVTFNPRLFQDTGNRAYRKRGYEFYGHSNARNSNIQFLGPLTPLSRESTGSAIIVIRHFQLLLIIYFLETPGASQSSLQEGILHRSDLT